MSSKMSNLKVELRAMYVKFLHYKLGLQDTFWYFIIFIILLVLFEFAR